MPDSEDDKLISLALELWFDDLLWHAKSNVVSAFPNAAPEPPSSALATSGRARRQRQADLEEETQGVELQSLIGKKD